VARTLVLERLANLFANPSDISQVEIAIGLTRSADANEGQFRLANGLDRIAGGAQPAGRGSGGYDLTNVRFNDGRLPAIDQVDFGRERVDTDDFMSIICETPRRNGADIAQSKNADSQNAYLSVWSSELKLRSAMSLEYRRSKPSVVCNSRIR
jgi:hypothetical protein